ncbi:MAG: hypothetical protein JWL59_3548 [Chthoniobacteraceae bacterium]|nr:hypothetical protein [Chthoniobacteraceae bacterium]
MSIEQLLPAKSKYLKPGDRCVWNSRGDSYEMFFVRRITRATHSVRSPKNVFRVPRFAGLDGPADTGIAEFSDKQVSQEVCRTQPNHPPLKAAA